MCGIAGYYSKSGPLPDLSRQRESLHKALLHRGPDEQTEYVSGNVHLFHFRFSIIGLSNGTQPLMGSDGKIAAIYNGEIYNYRELKAELEGKGYVFTKETDGEVIPYLYQEHGTEFVQRLNGEFAIALHDPGQDRFYLIRDRLGIKPLFYANQGESLIFASEAKGIIALDPNLASLDRSSLFAFAQAGFMKSPLSVFRSIRQLAEGSYLEVADGGRSVTEKRYWDVPLGESKEASSLSDVIDQATELLEDSMKLRLQSDVPVGAYLSSGIDSSTVAFLASRAAPTRMRAYTIDFVDKSFSEAEPVKELAAELGYNHKLYVHTDEATVALYPKMIFHGETPILTASTLAYCGLAAFAKQDGSDVIVGGEGADEVFCGYGFHTQEAKRKRLNGFPMGLFKAFTRSYFRRKGEEADFFPSESVQEGVARLFGRYSAGLEHYAEKGSFITSKLRMIGIDADSERRQFRELFDGMVESGRGFDDYDYLTYVDYKTWLQEHLLSTNGDRPSMASTVELRVPYLDHRLVEFMAKVRTSQKIAAKTDKYILRHLRIEGLPEVVRNRKKRPFGAQSCKPFFNQELRRKFSYIEQLTSPSSLKEKGYFAPDVLDEISPALESFYQGGKLANRAYLEHTYLTVLSVQLLDEIFVQGTSWQSIA